MYDASIRTPISAVLRSFSHIVKDLLIKNSTKTDMVIRDITGTRDTASSIRNIGSIRKRKSGKLMLRVPLLISLVNVLNHTGQVIPIMIISERSLKVKVTRK